MTQDFDPYHVWLGIPSDQQPANHYRLLGIETFEDDLDVIASAADKQMAHLRTFQAGRHGELTQKILNEVAAAKVCLLNYKRKFEYDRRLMESQKAQESEPDLAFVTEKVVPPRSSAKKSLSSNRLLLITGGGIAALLLGIMLVHFLSSASPQVAVAPATAEQHAKPPAAPAQPPPSPTVSTPTAKPVEASKPEPATEIKPIAPVKEEKLPPPPQKEKPTPVKPSEPAVAAPTAPESKSEGKTDKSRKLPVPDDAAQEKAKKVVDDLFKEELGKAKTSVAKQSLAKKLLQQGIDVPNDAAGRFVLFDTARELAIGANDGAVAFDVIDKMAEYFDVDAFAMKEEALTALAKSAHVPSAHQAIAEKALDVTQKAIDENNFDAAKELGKLALAEANKSRDKSVIQQVRSTGKNLQSAEKAFAEVEEAFNTLKERPEDLDANAIVGKYTCFVKGNWDTGLPMLIKGSDTALKDLATSDLHKPVKSEEQAAVADTWYELAGKEGASARKNIQLRAAHWYWLAFPDMKGGLEKVRVEKRMKGLAPLVASLPAPRQVVNKIDGSVLVLVPEGRFLFGEKKVPVELSAFYLGMYKVTNSQYKKFVDATGHRPSPHWGGTTVPAGMEDQPVVHVSWHDVVAYCRWAELRLPTEQEWEKGARGTDGRLYPWGNQWDNTKCQNAASKVPGRCSVFLYSEGRSPWGIYQMAGNVVEWTATSGLSKGSYSEMSEPRQFACYNRGGGSPEGTDPNAGFRVAKSIMP